MTAKADWREQHRNALAAVRAALPPGDARRYAMLTRIDQYAMLTRIDQIASQIRAAETRKQTRK
jgi:hypothetical protein